MKSKWFQIKDDAIALRKSGLSIRHIEKTLDIPRSTLSGWFKNVELSKEQKNKLFSDWKNGLVNARKKASLWHKEEANKRRLAIKAEIENFTLGLNIDKKIGELMLAMFYLAEGGKTENSFVIANSNPQLLKGIISLQRYLYALDESKFRCALHLRKDQNENELKKFWSSNLNIPESQFLKTQFDKRTIKKSYESYKGVCVLIYYDMALQRRILYLGEKILEIIKNLGV